MYTIVKRVVSAVQYSSFVTSFRVEILSLIVVGSGRKCIKSGHNTATGIGRDTTIDPNQYGIPDDNFNQYHCGLSVLFNDIQYNTSHFQITGKIIYDFRNITNFVIFVAI